MEGAAAARAGLLRSAEMETFCYVDPSTKDRIPLVGHAIRGLTEGFQGIGRLIRLGIMGLQECKRPRPG